MFQERPPWFILYDIQFVDENYGWIVGGEKLGRAGYVLSTQDGGEAWKEDEFVTGNGLYSVKFLTRNKGWIVGENGMILHTTRGGYTNR